MNIVIDNYRIRRYDSLNLCVEVHKQMGKSKNPYGRNGKPKNGEIAQKNESNKPKYKWDLVCYSPTLDYCLKKLVEHCLTNKEEINTIQTLRDQITQLNEEITRISYKETGVHITEQDVQKLGVYEHPYPNNFFIH